MDSIIIKNFEIFANHGVYKEENILGQKFVISAEIFTDNVKAGLTDNINDGINYSDICDNIRETVKNNTFKMIERLAEETARRLLLSFEKISKVSVEICKPWAPTGLHIENIGVRAERKKSRAYIGMGSNMEDRENHIREALSEINNNIYCTVKKTADFIETEPYGYLNQNRFINTVTDIETIMQPYELLEFLQKIENSHKRKRTVRWGPRTLDLDILMFDDIVISSEKLCIPHIEMHKREFVLKPFSQIAPYAVHPLKRKTIADIYDELKNFEKNKKSC